MALERTFSIIKPDAVERNKIGEIPISITLGKKTGVNNKIAGLTSMNVPDISMMTTNSSNILVGFKPNVDIDSDN